MTFKKLSVIAILIVILSVWTGNHILEASYPEGCNKCCDFNCQCSKSFGDSCNKKLHFQKSSCNFEYKQSLEIQAILPKNISNTDKGLGKNQAHEIAIISPPINILFNSINYYLKYTGNNQILLICKGCFQYRAPPPS